MNKISQFWKNISFWGVQKEMDDTQQQQVILSNQISITLVLVGFSAFFILYIQYERYALANMFLSGLLFFIFIPFINKIHQVTLSILLMSIFLPVYTLVMAVIIKKFYTDQIVIIQYLLPRVVILISVVLPLVLLDVRKKNILFYCLAVHFFCLIFFDNFHSLFEVGHEQAGIEFDNYFLINEAMIVAFLILCSAFIFLKDINYQYDKKEKDLLVKLQEVNIDFISKKLDLEEAYEELQSTNHSILIKNEQIEKQKAEIKEYSNEISRKKEILEEHSKILLALARNKYVQTGEKEKALREIIEVSAFALNLSRVSVWEYDADAMCVRCLDLFQYEEDEHQNQNQVLYLSDYPAYFNAVRFEKTIQANDAVNNIYTNELNEDYFTPYQIKSALHLSFFVQGELAGIIFFEQQHEYRDWKPEDVNFIISIAETMTVVYEGFERKQFIEELKRRKIEIEKQKDILDRNQQRLLHAQQIIQKQNEELENYNTDLEKIIEEKAQQLKETTKELDNFIYRASHDLRGPLTSLLGLCQVAVMDMEEDIGLRYIKMLNNIANQMQAILDSLIRVMEIKEGNIEKTNIDLGKTVDKILNKLAHYEYFENINLSIKIPENVKLTTDQELLDLIIFQILKNSVQYSNGSNYDKQSFIELEMITEGNTSLIRVTDNGLGIPDELGGKIFEMFFKGSKASKGNGLGLYMVKNALDKLGGKVLYRKSTEGNTVFEVIIPE